MKTVSILLPTLLLFFILNGCQLGSKKISHKKLKNNYKNRAVAEVSKNAGLQKDIDTVLSKIPKVFRPKLAEYINMIGVFGYDNPKYVGRDNEGLRNFNEVLLEESPCLSSLSEKYYNQMPLLDSRDETHLLSGDYSINYNSKQASWLLDYTLNFAKQNGNLAITLLGICGHDNAIGKVNNNGSNFHCPQNMYAPQALGVEYNISKQFIDKLASIQAPNLGAEVLPAKTYHIKSSSYLTCSLIRNGVPALMAKKIQNRLIYTYRVKRLCEVHLNGNYNFEKNLIGKTFKDFPTESLSSFISKKIDDCKGVISTQDCNELASLIGENTILSGDKKIISSFLKLYYSYRLIEKGLNVESLCSNVQVTDYVYNKLKNISKLKSDCGELDQNSCDIAKENIKTWVIDIDWSIQQHLLGSNIAAQLCTSGVSMKNIEEYACQLVK